MLCIFLQKFYFFYRHSDVLHFFTDTQIVCIFYKNLRNFYFFTDTLMFCIFLHKSDTLMFCIFLQKSDKILFFLQTHRCSAFFYKNLIHWCSVFFYRQTDKLMLCIFLQTFCSMQKPCVKINSSMWCAHHIGRHNFDFSYINL